MPTMATSADLTSLRNKFQEVAHAEPGPGQRGAAVLVLLVDRPGGWYLLLTRRTRDLSSHAGEISFAGGRVEAGESTLQAALREAHEELGIEPQDIDILGALAPAETRTSRYTIAPWVGVISPAALAALRPSPAEVAEVTEVPLSGLLAPGARREQRFIRAHRLVVSPAYDVGPDTIWGASARIVTELLAVIK
jgi:8-oxo-dGTP pyrophosphatase MutT (NUDIX family)